MTAHDRESHEYQHCQNAAESILTALSAAGFGPVQEAAREAWAHGHESGFWNGRLSQLTVPYDAPDPLIGKQHADATNPYREDM